MEKERVLKQLQGIVGNQNVHWKDVDLAVYEYDAGLGRGQPDFVVFPPSADEVSESSLFFTKKESATSPGDPAPT